MQSQLIIELHMHSIYIIQLRVQGHIRKRDLMMSRVGVYISVIIVLCHSIRLVPNFWEFWTRVAPVELKEVTNRAANEPLRRFNNH